MAKINLKEGRVYRTTELAKFTSNPTRLASELTRSGRLRRLRSGLYYAPKQSAFGEVPPSEKALLRGFFGSKPYLRTGPSVWSTLGLGVTAVEARPLIYNRTRTGVEMIGNKAFEFRRVRFPRKAGPEFFVVDLLNNTSRAGIHFEVVLRVLATAIEQKRFDPKELMEMAQRFGSFRTQRAIESTLPQ